MFRTRSKFSSRRRSPGSPQARLVLAGVLAVAVIGGFFTLVRLGDNAAPDPKEIRIELPDAFKP